MAINLYIGISKMEGIGVVIKSLLKIISLILAGGILAIIYVVILHNQIVESPLEIEKPEILKIYKQLDNIQNSLDGTIWKLEELQRRMNTMINRNEGLFLERLK